MGPADVTRGGAVSGDVTRGGSQPCHSSQHQHCNAKQMLRLSSRFRLVPASRRLNHMHRRHGNHHTRAAPAIPASAIHHTRAMSTGVGSGAGARPALGREAGVRASCVARGTGGAERARGLEGCRRADGSCGISGLALNQSSGYASR